ncbi:hypothetical protein C8Q76DRAFT_803015 [Earliella scabrosa]|nr:hypothetical protein C8Q76DRAFT_803015 [Earliella scabrosa]
MSQSKSHPACSRHVPPPPEAVEVVRDYCSQLYYAWKERPATTAPARIEWNKHFVKTCKGLGKELDKHRFTSLPPFVIGCIWEFNKFVHSKADFLDAEAITEAVDRTHPALDHRSPRGLRYAPASQGLVTLRERHEMRNTWWEIYNRPEKTSTLKDLEAESAPTAFPSTSKKTHPAGPPNDAVDIAGNITQDLPADHVTALEASISDTAVGVSSPRRGTRGRSASVRARTAEPLTPPVTRKGKRKASRSPPQDHGPRAPSVTSTASDIRPEQEVPATVIFPTGGGCEGCQKVGAVCEVDTFAGTVCKHCRKNKVKCSFMRVVSKPLRCYLVWRFWKLSHQPADGVDVTFIPSEYSSPSATPPAWWETVSPTQPLPERKRRKTSEPRVMAPPSVVGNRSRSRSRSHTIPPAPAAAEELSEHLTAATPLPDCSDHPAAEADGAQSAGESPQHPDISGPNEPGPDEDPTWTVAPTQIFPPPSARALRARARSRAPSQNASVGTPGVGLSSSIPVNHELRGKSTTPVLRVPMVDGSWRNLPTLQKSSAHSLGSSSTENLPLTRSYVLDPWPPRVRVPEAAAVAVPEHIVPRPPTPPASAFQPGPATIQLAEDAQQRLSHIHDLRFSLERAAAEAEKLARDSHIRTQAEQTEVTHPEASQEALALLATQHAELAANTRRCAEVLARVSRSLMAICSLFDLIPPIPMNDRALLEMLDLVCQLRSLYGAVQESHDRAQDNLRPLQRELCMVRDEQQVVLDRLDQIPNDVSSAVYPLLHNLYLHLSEGHQTSRSDFDSILARSQLGEQDRDRLLQLFMRGAPRFVASDGASNSAPASDLTDVLTQVLALRTRVDAVEKARGFPGDNRERQGESGSELLLDQKQLRDEIASLETRVTTLEGSPDMGTAVQAYLEQLGLDIDTLRRLAQYSSKTASYPFPGWSWASGSK